MSSPSRPRKSEDVEGLKASIFKAIRGAEISHHEKKDRSPELWFRRRSRSRSQESDTASTSKAFAKSSDIKRASTSSLVEEKAKSISRDGKGIGINDSQSIVRKNIISDANDYQLRQSNLLQKREDRYSRLKSPGVCFSLACAIGDLEMVKNLLHQKPELIHYAPAINHGYGGLHYAAKGGHIDVARYLLRKGANINLQTVVSVWK